MVNIRKLKILLSIIFFKIILEISYVEIINPIWGYMGFELNINFFKLIESYFLIIITYFLMPKLEVKMSNIFIQFLFLMMIVPTLSLYGMKDEPRLFVYLFTLSFIITILTVRIFPKINITKIMIPRKGLFTILAVVTLFTYLYLIKDNGIPTFQALNLLNVYEVRGNFNVSLGLLKYLMTWQAKIINPFFIGYFLYKKDYRKFTFIVILQLFLFLITAHKSFLFAIVLVIGVYYLTKKRKFLRTFSFGLFFISFISMVLGVFGISTNPALFLINRVFFVPAQNYFFYYDFFSQNSYVYLAQSLVGTVFGIDTQYNLNVTYMMGDIYYGSPRVMVNTGYLADAYMNFGVLGMISYSILLGCIFVLIDQLCKNMNLSMSLAPFIFPIYSLVDGALLTTLLTHGLAVSILIAFISNNKINNKSINLGTPENIKLLPKGVSQWKSK